MAQVLNKFIRIGVVSISFIFTFILYILLTPMFFSMHHSIYIRTGSSKLLLCRGTFVSFLASLSGQRQQSSVLCILLCLTGPKSYLNLIRRYKLTVLKIYTVVCMHFFIMIFNVSFASWVISWWYFPLKFVENPCETSPKIDPFFKCNPKIWCFPFIKGLNFWVIPLRLKKFLDLFCFAYTWGLLPCLCGCKKCCNTLTT